MNKKLIAKKGQVIGITGNICSGKSFALKFLRKMGFNTISMDALIHKALEQDEEIKQEISKTFPNALQNGEISRTKLGGIVFQDKIAMQQLESILHPYTHNEIKKLAQSVKDNRGARSIVIEVPLLFEKNREVYFDRIICLTSSHATALKRALLRKNMNEEKFSAILSNQMPPEEKIHKADYLIYNENRFHTLHVLNQLIINGRFKRGRSRH